MSELTYQISWPSKGSHRDAAPPEGWLEWLEDNNIRYALTTMGGFVFGLKLKPEDAVAYKLRFGA